MSDRELLGFVEHIDAEEVRGWVFDPSKPADAISVAIFHDIVLQGVILADEFRDDLQQAGIGNGKHAFRWRVPRELKDFSPSLISVSVDAWQVPVDEKVAVYLAAQAEVERATEERQNPLQLLERSELFDRAYAADRIPDKKKREAFVKDPTNVLLADEALEIKPHPLFEPAWYRERYKDRISAGQHPLLHYLTEGMRDGLMPNFGFVPDWYLRFVGPSEIDEARRNPVIHYFRHGWRRGASPHPFFQPAWYLDKHADIKRSGIEPLSHYLDSGHREGRQLHPLIDSEYYAKKTGTTVAVLDDYWRRGINEGVPTHLMLDVGQQASVRKSPYTPPQSTEPLQAWLSFNRANNKRSLNTRKALGEVKHRALLSIVIPVYDPPLNVFRDVIARALKQSYTNFEIIIVDDRSTHESVREEIRYLASADSRIKAIFHETNTHISRATNDAADVALGDYLVFLDHDDVLMEDALAILVVYINAFDSPDVLYSDDCRTDLSGFSITAARFKPAWSPELLLSYSYASHLRAVKTQLYKEIGGSRIGYEGSQDHDMFLRLDEAGARVVHIPFVLYGRRAVPGSTALSGDQKPYSYDAGQKAIKSAFERRGLDVDVVRPDWAIRHGLGIYKPVMPHDGPSVSIIIPTKNNARTLVRLLRSLSLTLYRNFDVLVLDNESDDPATLEYLKKCPYRVERVLNGADGFNFSRINNLGSKMVDGELLLFLNDDTEVLAPEWLSQMVGWSRLAGVGAVGARLLFANRRVQHGGVSPEQTVGYTMFRGLPGNEHGYLSSAVVTRNCSGVTAACLLTPKDLFLRLNGFNETAFGVAFNDVDYCLRVQKEGLRIVYCAEAELYHHEGTSRPKVDKPSEVACFKAAYGDYIDPYLNQNLDRSSNRMDIASVVVTLPVAASPPRVLFCSHNFNNEGAPNSLFELISGLNASGHVRASVVGPQPGPLMAAYREAGIETLVNTSIGAVAKVKTRSEYEAACNHIVDSLGLGDFDVVFSNTAEMHAIIHSARQAGVPSIWCIREGEHWNEYYAKLPEEIEVKALEAFAIPYRVTFVSNASSRNWSALNTNHNFTTITNGLDVARFKARCEGFERDTERRRLGIDADEVTILAVGGVISRKGQHDLILSLACLPEAVQRQIQVIIVGARHNFYSERLSAAIENYPDWLRDRITIVPETRSIGQYYVASDIFFCGSRVESYPRIILEAELSGLPIITTPVSGIPEQVYEGVNALFYDPGRIRHLAKLVEELVLDPYRRKDLGRQSQIVFKSLLTYERMQRRYQTIIAAAAMSSVPGAAFA